MSAPHSWWMGISDQWWSIVLPIAWQAALVAVIALAINRFGRRLPSTLRYALLAVALIKFVLPPTWSAPTGVIDRAARWCSDVRSHDSQEFAEGSSASDPSLNASAELPFISQGSGELARAGHLSVDTGPNTEDVAMTTVASLTSELAGETTAEEDATLSETASVVLRHDDTLEPRSTSFVPSGSDPQESTHWASSPFAKTIAFVVATIGSVLLLLGLLRDQRRLARLTRGSQHLRSGALFTRFRRQCRSIGIRRTPRLLLCREARAPASFGLLRPAVLVPLRMTRELDSREIDSVFAHELVHLRRHDPWWNMAQLVIVSLWWFHPVVWLLSVSLRRVREDCCDDELLRNGVCSNEEYCQTLLKVAAGVRGRTLSSAAVAMAHGEHALARRFRRLMDPRERKPGRSSVLGKTLCWLTVPVFALAFLPGLGGAAAPQVPQDAPPAEPAAPGSAGSGDAAPSVSVEPAPTPVPDGDPSGSTPPLEPVDDADEKTARVLDETSIHLKFENVSFEDAIEWFRLNTGLSFSVDSKLLGQIKQDVNVKLHAPIPARKALELVLALTNSDLSLGYRIDGGVIRIVKEDPFQGAIKTMVYGTDESTLRQILEHLRPEDDEDGGPELAHLRRTVRELIRLRLGASEQPITDRFVLSLGAGEDASQALETVRAAWMDAGRPSMVSLVYDLKENAIVVEGEKRSVASVVAKLTNPQDRSLEKRLGEIVIPAVSFEDEPLTIVAEIVTAFSGIRVEVESEVAARLDRRGSLVDLEAENVRLDRLLDRVAEVVSADVMWDVGQGSVVFCDADRLTPQSVVRVHPLVGLVGRHVLVKDLRTALASVGWEPSAALADQIRKLGAGEKGEVFVELTPLQLVELVLANPSPVSWRLKGATAESAANNSILVVQTPRIHDEIHRALSAIGKAVHDREAVLHENMDGLLKQVQGQRRSSLNVDVRSEGVFCVNGHWLRRSELEGFLIWLRDTGRSPAVELHGASAHAVASTLELLESQGFRAVTLSLAPGDTGGPKGSAKPPESPASSKWEGRNLNDVIGVGRGAGEGYSGRYGRRGSGKGGGSASQRAARMGLEWLQKHQEDDGSWDTDGFADHCRELECYGKGGGEMYDVGTTALALLAFLGAGHTDRLGNYQDVVRRAMQFLQRQQDGSDGCVGSKAGQQHFMYGHALGSLAFVEAYALTGDPQIRDSAQRAVDFIARARNPYKAWRYSYPPDGDNDVSVTCWMLTALILGREAGLAVDQAAIRDGLSYIEEMTDNETGRTGYHERGSSPARDPEDLSVWPPQKSESMTAAALFVRLLNGEDKNSPAIQRGAELLYDSPPRWSETDGSIDYYYWYYGTYAAWQIGGRVWNRWQKEFLNALVRNQKVEQARGSWNPQVDPWGDQGGRVYATAINTLSLLVYTRYDR